MRNIENYQFPIGSGIKNLTAPGPPTIDWKISVLSEISVFSFKKLKKIQAWIRNIRNDSDRKCDKNMRDERMFDKRMFDKRMCDARKCDDPFSRCDNF